MVSQLAFQYIKEPNALLLSMKGSGVQGSQHLCHCQSSLTAPEVLHGELGEELSSTLEEWTGGWLDRWWIGEISKVTVG